MHMVNDLCDIADRIDQLLADANGLGKPMRLLMDELADYSDELRDQASDIVDQMVKEMYHAD